MKLLPNILGASILLSLGALTSCADYLDIVPEETQSEKDTYADKNKAREFLYSCYGLLPNPSNAHDALDLLTGDEVVTPFEHEVAARIPKGNYSSSDPVISYWRTLFKGIRQCYMFEATLDKNAELTDEMKNDYRGQINFLIAYYHYLLAINYGPISLVKSEPDIRTKQEDFLGRSPYDECVEWICQKFDEAATQLPVQRESQAEFGLATSLAAKAFKAKLLVYAASPLFNGGKPELFADFKDKDGVLLMPTTYDPAKWIKAKAAVKEAIDAAEAAGVSLYMKDNYASQNRFPAVGVQRRLRMIDIDWKEGRNPEVIFADTRPTNPTGIQHKSMPIGRTASVNGIAPTWAMVNRFYTKNGLPWDVDPAYKDQNKLEVFTFDEEHKDYGMPGRQTIRFNIDREPRFYAWIGFQGGYYEILNKNPNDKKYTADHMPLGEGRVVLNFLKNGHQGRGNRSNWYCPSGYLNKKLTYPEHLVARSGGLVNSGSAPIDHPWPLIRLGDLYLLYAEACVETNDLDDAKAYLNRIRTRAGIPTVEDSWALVPGATLDQSRLRDIVRQERMIELYLESQNFWDMRRWLLAEQYFNVKAQGLNIEATTMADFAQLRQVDFERAFRPANYLMPIPIGDINKVAKLVNNPGY